MAPSFGNIGREARNLFDIGYDVLDGFRLDVNTYKKLGISAGGIQGLETGDVVTSYFETRYKLKKFNCCESFPIKDHDFSYFPLSC